MDRELERTIRGQKFESVSVDIDGTEFIDCEFDRCTLVYSGGGLFIFDNSPIDSCTLTLEGPAENTLFALSSMYNSGMAEVVERLIAMVRNPLGDTSH